MARKLVHEPGYVPPVAPGEKMKKRGACPVYTALQTREQEQYIERLMLTRSSLTYRAAYERVRAKFGISQTRYRKIRARIMDRWTREDDQMRPAWKSQAMRRLNMWIRKMERESDFKLVQRFHSDLMTIQGVREPVRLDLHVEVQESVAQVIMELTPEQLDDALNEYRQTQALAAAAKRLGVGDVTNDAAE